MHPIMRNIPLTLAVASLLSAQPATAEILLNSWLTEHSAQYARIYQTDSDQAAGNTSTTWTRGAINQYLPSYAGVQEISFSANWVYIQSTGLGIHTMGPWYGNVARTNFFPNLPYGEARIYRFPRESNIPASKVLTGLGTIGYFVDGVAMFDIRDAFWWNGTGESAGGTGGYWNRDAVVNEWVTMDPANAHQPASGIYHYHANPIALRFLLGDNVHHNSATGHYSENPATPEKHSPLLGWVRDGFPVYGPYGYSDPMDHSSSIRRIISGYALRNGQSGTDNLAATGRVTIPAWATRAYGVTQNQSGPGVSGTYPLGRYIEDNAFRGDLGFTQGIDFDLDEHNGRFCVTPEFPQGTYAYFITITETGTPAFPYHIGRTFHGQPTGAAVTQIREPVTLFFEGGPVTPPKNRSISRTEDEIVLVWDAVEGGYYKVQSSDDLVAWEQEGSEFVATATTTSFTAAADSEQKFFRLEFTGKIEPHLNDGSPPEPATGPITLVSPANASRGETNRMVTFTLAADATPPLPPAHVIPSIVTIGAIAGTGLARLDLTTVRAFFTFPLNGPTGAQTVTITFPGPGGQTGPSYIRESGFTIIP